MLAFFMTPILWQPTMLPERTLFLRANPAYYLVELFRRPLLGDAIDPGLWIGSLVVMFSSLIIGVTSFLFFRRRIAYWL
jgi:ABC-type polysaccharide/polyol phosphate export permease